MKIKRINICQFFILSMLMAFSCFPYATQSESPEKILKYFYYTYITENDGLTSGLVEENVLSNVINSVNNSSQCNYDSDDSVSADDLEKICAKKRDCKENKGDYICNWDGVWVETDVNYFTKSQDVYPSWSRYINVTLIKKSDTGADFEVSLGQSPEPIMKLKVALVIVDRSWKISSVTKY